ncbi:MFS transporter [Nocardia sp. NBC_01329]|uniref:MFS transporter n=1 Tax=Nocardia sp. NBC_01329 TaxID=2903594 RepID=UPI002E15562C|nr:MFS transporter [Nocardia sp. NBC_01329]
MLEVLGHQMFRRLFTAQVVALAGTGLLTVALGLLAYDRAGAEAGAVLGTALAIKMVAYVAVAPVVAAVTDRLPRRAVLVTADIVRAAVALGLPLVDQVWQIYVLIFVLQAASATFTPAFQSIIPSVLPAERDYSRALSLSRLAYDLEAVLSPLLAAVALTVMGYHWLFLGTVAGFFASALLVVTTALPLLPAPDRSVPLTARIVAGARVMGSRPVLRGLLALNLVVAAGTGLVLVNTVVYVRDLLGGSDTGVAIALSCFGGGSMLVALAMPRLLTTASDRTVMFTGAAVVPAALAVATVLLAVEPGPTVSWFVLALAWLTLGAATSLINTPTARLLRYRSDERERAAVFTAQFSLSHACFLLTYPIAGWVGVQAGHAIAAAVSTVVATLAAITAARLWPADEQVAPIPVAVG